MSRIGDLKQTFRTTLLGILGESVGTIDTARFDPDENPRKLRPGVPYWSLTVGGFEDVDAAFGTSSRPLFRTYSLQMEGWLGIQGTDEQTDAWEALVERVADELQLHRAQPAQLARVSLLSFPRLGVPTIDVIVRGQNTRYHHAVIRAEAQCFVRLQRSEVR